MLTADSCLLSYEICVICGFTSTIDNLQKAVTRHVTSDRRQISDQRSAFKIGTKLFSFPALLAALLVGAVFVVDRAFRVDPDVWWHLKVGETILRTHRVPTSDPYSFTVPGSPWMAYEWLGEVLLAAVSRVGGLRGLLALEIALAAAIVLSLYALATLRCGNCKAGFVACVLMLMLAPLSFTLRPQMLGYLFLVLTLITLGRFQQGKPGALWLLPPLFLVWVNTHGSFIIGLGVIGVYWASGLVELRAGGLGARRWTTADRLRLELVALLCLIALAITPYGARLAIYPFDMTFGQPLNVANIQEWQSMPFDVWFGKVFLVLLLGFLAAQIALRPAWRVEELALFLVGTFMACLHRRFVLVFVPFFAPPLAALLAPWLRPSRPAKDKYALNAILMAVVVAGAIGFFPTRTKLQSLVAERYPVRAVQYLLDRAVPSPMYNQYGFGGYLIWSLGPERKVFVDGRADIYEYGGVLADYIHISKVEPEALPLLRGYGVRSCLLARDEPLATLLLASGGWQRVYADKVAMVFVRLDQPQRH